MSVRAAAAGLVMVVLLSGCRGNQGYEGPYAAEVNAAIPRIERAMGVPFLEPPRLELRNHSQVREFLEQRFAEDLPDEELAGVEASYKRFGLVPDSLDLRTLYLTLLVEQIVGFYDPKTKVLYLVEEAPASQRGVIITHELIHALQDQYVNLDSIQSIERQNDKSLAAQAVIEGQAMFLQLEAAAGGAGLAARLPGGWDRVRQGIRDNQALMPQFSRAPLIVQETLIFPYLSGAEFVRRRDFSNGTDAFAALPMSTEQVMHHDAYGDSTDAPTRVVFAPRGGNVDVIHENGLGEFEIRVLLFDHLEDQNAAVRGAAGWDGDRYQLVRSGSSNALLWATVWDTESDADEFAELISRALSRRYGDSAPPADRRSFVLQGRRVVVERAELDGRPMVFVEDRPESVSARMLAPAMVSLEAMPATANMVR